MVFSAPFFLYLFLPLFLAVYYALPARYRIGWILAGSWVFYAFWRPDFLALVMLVSAGNWVAGTVKRPSPIAILGAGDEIGKGKAVIQGESLALRGGKA